jgi:hypothetical protein
MNRREFLLSTAGRPPRVLEWSCERLYMKYLDSRLDETTEDMFASLEVELRAADELRVTDCAWLAREDLKAQLDPVLEGFRSRGGRVRAVAPNPKSQ